MAESPLTLSLFTDFYELTMAQAYWQSGQVGPATFSLFFRNYPPERAYFVFAGLADVLDYLENFQFADCDVAYLRSLGRFDQGFLAHLRQLRFTGSVRAMREGALAFINEPVLELTAPIIEAQLVETFLVNQVNVETVLATKAARVVHAARGREVIDFAARRTHGVEAANKLARAGYLVGYGGTSNTLAGALYGIPVSGTMAHSYIMSFTSEIDAFRHFSKAFPDTSTFLVDTYDSLEGTRKAAAVAQEMKQRGRHLVAIRLDSGDLLDLSLRARSLLDQAGLREVKIFASGGLDEFEIHDLLEAGAPIDGFGVGTKVGVSADAPWTDCVYKLVEYAGRPVLKLSTKKQTLPGPKQVFRHRAAERNYAYDVIAAGGAEAGGGQPLLEDVMRDGKRSAAQPSLEQMRHRFREEFAGLAERHKAIRSAELYDVRVSAELQRLEQRIAQEARKREIGDVSG
jgi:nicotinate phosphoribosyltransferase